MTQLEMHPILSSNRLGSALSIKSVNKARLYNPLQQISRNTHWYASYTYGLETFYNGREGHLAFPNKPHRFSKGRENLRKLTFQTATMLPECPVRGYRKMQRRLPTTTLNTGKRNQQPGFRACDKLRHGKEKNWRAFSQKCTHILRKRKWKWLADCTKELEGVARLTERDLRATQSSWQQADPSQVTYLQSFSFKKWQKRSMFFSHFSYKTPCTLKSVSDRK